MARYHGTNSDGEPLASMFVEIENRDQFGLDCSNLPSLTRQEFAADADINTIMAQYEKTGVISHLNQTPPQYLDLSDVPDLQQSIDLIREAETAFMSLPAVVRATFDNNAVKFVEFAQNPANIDKMREWNLAPPPPAPPEPQKVEIVNTPLPDVPAPVKNRE